MEAPQAVTGFDAAERERIRAALRRYMSEHRIGTPALQDRIIKADKPRHREIPLSTLQRFITGKHHTQEHHVALCHAFVEALPYYGEGREMEQLGTALALFTAAPAEAYERAMRSQKLARDIAGTYEVRFRLDDEQDTASGKSLAVVRSVPYARITFAADPENRYLRVAETVFNPGRAYPFEPGKASGHHIYEGAFVALDWRAFVVLRNQLTRLPKIYWIRDVNHGQASEFPFVEDPVLSHYEFSLVRTNDHGGDE